jgi:Ca-activated chloride channel family protein
MRQIVQDGIMKLDEHEVKQEGRVRAVERYQWPLGVGVLLVGGALLLGEGGRRRALQVLVFAALCLGEGRDGFAATAAASQSAGRELYEAGDYAGAFETYRSELARQPGSAELAYNAGTAAYKNKKWVEAMEAFGAALASKDRSLRSRAEYNFANTLVQQAMQGRRGMDTRALEEALEHYSAALKEDPGLGDAEYNQQVVRQLLEKKKQQEQQKQQQEAGGGGQKNPQDSKQDQNEQNSGENQEQNSSKDGSSGKQGDSQKGKSPDSKPGEESQREDQKSGGDSKSSQGKEPKEKRGGDSANAQNSTGEPPQSEPVPEKAGESKPRGELKNDPEQVDPNAVARERARQQGAMQAGGDGRITKAQAAALIEALRSEDRRVHLWTPDAKQQKDAKAREGRSW